MDIGSIKMCEPEVSIMVDTDSGYYNLWLMKMSILIINGLGDIMVKIIKVDHFMKLKKI